MKRYLSVCLLWACFLALWGQSAGDGYGDTNAPSNPGNPNVPEVKYTFTLKATEGGTVSQSPSGNRHVPGTRIYVSASINENYKFVNWLQGDSVVSTSTGFYYTMPAKDVELKAVFKFYAGEYGDGNAPSNPGNPNVIPLYYQLSAEASPSEGGSVSVGSSKVQEGTSTYVNASPNAGYQFKGWMCDGELMSTERRYNFVMESRKMHFTGLFEYNPSLPDSPSNNPGNVTAYTLTYVIEGQTYYTERVPAGATLTNIGTPVRKGYTFDGWEEVPAVMPEADLTINGSFTVNKYTVTYIIEGNVYKTETVAFGTTVPVISAPAKEGYNFDGWKDMPASMPAEDITLTGSYSVNKDLKYNVIYIVDGKEYKREPVSFDDPVTLLPDPVKEGHTFSGWKGEVPERMPFMMLR